MDFLFITVSDFVSFCAKFAVSSLNFKIFVSFRRRWIYFKY